MIHSKPVKVVRKMISCCSPLTSDRPCGKPDKWAIPSEPSEGMSKADAPSVGEASIGCTAFEGKESNPFAAGCPR